MLLDGVDARVLALVAARGRRAVVLRRGGRRGRRGAAVGRGRRLRGGGRRPRRVGGSGWNGIDKSQKSKVFSPN